MITINYTARSQELFS